MGVCMAQSDEKPNSDPSWWEQVTRPLRRSFGTAPLEEPKSEPPAASPAETPRGTHPLDPEPLPAEPAPRPVNPGTHPLAPDTIPAAEQAQTADQAAAIPAAEETAAVPESVDLDGTRPLSAEQLAVALDLDSTRPLSAAVLPKPESTTPIHDVVAPTQPTILAAALRDIGRTRSVNQDSIYALVSSVPRGEQDLNLGLFVVADGMGGHASGEVASRIAITTVARHVLAELLLPALDETFGTSLREVVVGAVETANRAIWDQANIDGLDMGTTCTVALILGRTIYIGHVGDSRAYLLQGGMLEQITTDHSAVGRLIQIGELTPEDAREHPLRSHLYRTIGQTPEVQVDFVQQPIGQASYLLLCSDGLWSMLEDATLATILNAAPWPHDICSALIDAANEAGGEDNISAVVVRL
jgi:PPM family protein phosphatase